MATGNPYKMPKFDGSVEKHPENDLINLFQKLSNVTSHPNKSARASQALVGFILSRPKLAQQLADISQDPDRMSEIIDNTKDIIGYQGASLPDQVKMANKQDEIMKQIMELQTRATAPQPLPPPTMAEPMNQSMGMGMGMGAPSSTPAQLNRLPVNPITGQWADLGE